MKKVCSVLFSIVFLSASHDVLAQNEDSSKKNKEEIKIEKKDIPTFADINSIYENENVQDEVRELQYRILQLLRTIGKSNPNEKKDADQIKGNKHDIDQAKRRVDYLASLESNLEKANTLDRVKNLLSLNSSGKEEVQKAKDLIEAVEDADAFEKVRAIPRINKKINNVIDKYETLEKIIETTDSVDKIKNIPGIDPKSLEEIQLLEKRVEDINSLSDIQNVINSSALNKKLKDQVAKLMNLETDVQNADNFEKLKKLPGVNEQIIAYINSQIEENEQLKQQLKKLEKEKNETNDNLNESIENSEKERRFSTRLIGVILRALIGFDYRSKRYDFTKNKDLKIADKSVLVAAYKNSFSYLGGTEKDLCTITNGLQYILQVLISEKNWIKKAAPIKDKLEKINILCKKLNSDAEMIKLNVDHALTLISNLLDGAKRPLRDNVKNFDQTELQSAKNQ